MILALTILAIMLLVIYVFWEDVLEIIKIGVGLTLVIASALFLMYSIGWALTVVFAGNTDSFWTF